MTKLFRVARFQFLICGMALFAFGALWAVLLGAPVYLSRILLGYLVLLPAHLSVSYSNDYFDVDVDKYDKPTIFTGGSGVLVDDPGLRKPAKWIAITLILCSLALGIIFTMMYSFPIWFLGFVVLGNLLGWFYSAPPLRLAYRGLGELSMTISIGLLIPGLGFLVTTGQLNWDGLVFILPLTLYGLAFIINVEIPDMESDRLGNKRTWVARKGRSFGFIVISASFFLATLFFLCVPWLSSRIYPLDFRFLGILSLLPLGAGCIGLLRRPLEKQSATRVVNGIMITIAALCFLMDGYMVYLVFN
jgi:1,4-dihydroxy-2-naphthoate octaprenyltransferase